MLSHVTVGVGDLSAAQAFYDDVLATLGYARLTTVKGGAGYGLRDDPGASFWIVLPLDGKPASAGNGAHIALLAPTRQAVDEFHSHALAAGGGDEGGPGLREHYHPHYYAAYMRDLDGNKVQAVCHHPACE